MNATMEHLVKFLKKKQDTRNFGSVLVHFRDGEITGITEKNDFNAASFVEHVEHPLKRYVVRTKKEPLEVVVAEREQIDENCTESVEIDENKNNNEVQENL
jgi:hypothetical protein